MYCIDGSTEEGKLKKVLVGGSSIFCKRMSGFVFNGYKFYIIDRERN